MTDITSVPARLQLTKEQRDNLVGIADRIQWLKEELARAKRAGIADDDMESKLNDLVKLRNNILREYT